MNCKPMDMAIVTRTSGSGCDCVSCQSERLTLGKIVRVVRLCSDGVWKIEEPIDIVVDAGFFRLGVRVTGIADEFLTPLPGLEVDEVVRDEVTI